MVEFRETGDMSAVERLSSGSEESSGLAPASKVMLLSAFIASAVDRGIFGPISIAEKPEALQQPSKMLGQGKN